MIIKAGPIWFAKPITDPFWVADESGAALIDLNSARVLAHIRLLGDLTFVRLYLPWRRAFRLRRQARYVFGDAVLTWCFPRLELLVAIDGGSPLSGTREWVEAALRQ
jgi:hypothetical protein